MTSDKQIAANRENALRSTGPKSEAGKQTSSMNALRHGLTGQIDLMPQEDREAHDQFCAALVADLAPEGALEIQFAQSVAEDNWRLNRGRAIETNMFAFGADHPETGDDQIDNALSRTQVFATDPRKFQLLSLYMQRTNRDMQKTLDRLTALQTERKARRQHDLEETASLLQLKLMKHIPVTETGMKGQNGFVFSIPEIRAFIDRRRHLIELTNLKNQSHNHHGKHKNNNNHLLRSAA
jgi:hypothetical protein